MSILTIAILALTITTGPSVVKGTDCECEYNYNINQFYGDQECYNTRLKLTNHFYGREYYNDTTISKLIDTFCNGNCGSLLNNILYYEKHIQARYGDSTLDSIMAKVYCSGENNCWKIPEADENKTVQALSQQGECNSLVYNRCYSSCQNIINEFVEDFGCCSRALLEMLSYRLRYRYANSYIIFSSCDVPDPGSCSKALGESISDGGGATNLKTFGLAVILCVATIASF